MSTLSNQERHALDDVFLSISSSKNSFLKYKFSHYHAYLVLNVKARLKAFNLQDSIKNTLKITFLQKNSQKNKKTRKI